jgi:hypothetical protein
MIYEQTGSGEDYSDVAAMAKTKFPLEEVATTHSLTLVTSNYMTSDMKGSFWVKGIANTVKMIYWLTSFL